MKSAHTHAVNPANPAEKTMQTRAGLRLKAFFARLSSLQIAATISVLVHALLLTLRFVDPEGFNRVFKNTPLEVVLVNAHAPQTASQAQKAQVIAQHHLAGGGEAAQGLATTPLPLGAGRQVEVASEEEAQIQALQRQQMRLLAGIRQQIARMPVPDKSQAAQSAGEHEQEKKRQELLQMLAAIEKRIQEENARPKKRYISPATRQAVYAVYYDALRSKIERFGTANFPVGDDGRKLYGELIVVITIDKAGQVVSVEISGGGSGNRQLDRRAQAIVRQAAPFGVFSQEMRQTADQLVVVARFQFTKNQALEATLGGQ